MIQQLPFLRLWLATTASGLATWALPFVLGFAVIDGFMSATTMGILMGVRTAGFLFGVLAGGLLADRFSSRLVVFGAGLVAAVATPALAFTAGGLLWIAIVAAALVGVGQGAVRPAFQALIPQVVALPDRQRANALVTLAVRVTTLLGPAATAIAARFVSIEGLIGLIGVAWLLAALLPTAGKPASPSQRRSSFVNDIVVGFAEARRHRWFLAGLAALVPIMALGFSATSIVLPIISKETYGGNTVFTWAITSYTLGALLGAILMTKWRPKNEGWVAFAGLALYSLTAVMMLVLPAPILVYAAYLLGGIGIELFNVPWFTATQREVSPDKLARVTSVDFLVSYGLMPLGLAALPWAVTHFGQTSVLIATAVTAALGPAIAALVPGARTFADPNVQSTKVSR